MQELWTVFPVDKEKGEVNVWSKDLVDFKKAIKRATGLWTMTEAYVGRWDLVANELYGDVYLWWVVPLANDVMDIFSPNLIGAFLRVPAYQDVWEWVVFQETK
jgi:hypothetical protein